MIADELSYQSKLRQAIYGAVSESDVSAMVKKIVEDARAGDRKAQDLVFKYLLGAGGSPKITFNNLCTDPATAAKLMGRKRKPKAIGRSGKSAGAIGFNGRG
jgi:hypothetical protein